MLFRFAKRFFKKNPEARLSGCGESPNSGGLAYERGMMASDRKKVHFGIDPQTREIVLGKWRMALPSSPLPRILIGLLLVVGGLLGFLPVLGFWMVPLGLLILSHDIPFVRRQRRKLAVWWARRRGAQNSSGGSDAGA